MRKLPYIIIVFLLFVWYSYADEIKAPPILQLGDEDPLKDDNKKISDYFTEIYNNLHNLEVVETTPDGNRRGSYGDIVIFKNASLYSVYVNSSSNAIVGTEWKNTDTNTEKNPTQVQNFVQRVNIQHNNVATGSKKIPLDDTTPQQNEGNQFMLQAITPESATNRLKIDVIFTSAVAVGGGGSVIVGLFRDDQPDALTAGLFQDGESGHGNTIPLSYDTLAETTGEITFRVQAGAPATATMTFGGEGGTRYFGTASHSSITITEYTP